MGRYKSLLILVAFYVSLGLRVIYSQDTNDYLNITQKKRMDSLYKLNNVQIKAYGIPYFYADCSNQIIISSQLIDNFIKEFSATNKALLTEGILSHEYAHIKQCSRSKELFDSSNSALRELHADFIAGYYLSKIYKANYMSDTSTASIFKQICAFFNKENESLNLIVAMLINSDYEYSYSMSGFDNESFKIMRFTAVWRGFANSNVRDVDEAYRLGMEIAKRLIKDKESSRTFIAFRVVGIDILNKILKGKLLYKSALKEILSKINQPDNRLTNYEKAFYTFVISNGTSIDCK